MNSGGIGLLVMLLVRAQRNRQRVLAYGLSEHYRQIFELTRLDEAVEHPRQRGGRARVRRCEGLSASCAAPARNDSRTPSGDGRLVDHRRAGKDLPDEPISTRTGAGSGVRRRAGVRSRWAWRPAATTTPTAAARRPDTPAAPTAARDHDLRRGLQALQHAGAGDGQGRARGAHLHERRQGVTRGAARPLRRRPHGAGGGRRRRQREARDPRVVPRGRAAQGAPARDRR